MLKVQQYLLKKGNSLESLKKDFAIEVTESPIGEPLVILNYCQIDSPKYSPVTKECRGLVLNKLTYEVVAKPFSRFFNYSESREEINKFNWTNFEIASKEDGSILIVYYYNGTWRVNTRASFGIGAINNSEWTWEKLFWNTIEETGIDHVPSETTLIFELCSVYNKVVRHYPEPKLFLLAAFNSETCEEKSNEACEYYAKVLEVERPKIHSFSSIEEILSFLEEPKDVTFEGFVLKDGEGNRIKVKSKSYLRLHKMRGNGSCLFSAKTLIPFIVTGELGELLAIYPETAEYVEKYTKILSEEFNKLETLYSNISSLTNQKEFAIIVTREAKQFSSLLFEARKQKLPLKKIWEKSADFLVKVFS